MTSARNARETEITPIARHCMDEDGWHDVVRRFAPYVHAVAHAHQLPEADAEAVFTEVFLQTWTATDRLDGDEAIRGWIVGLTHRLASERREALGPMIAPPPYAHLMDLRRALLVSGALRRPAPRRLHRRSRERRRRTGQHAQGT
jgi:DNA-directed RNA polymerase specialized sigma24 family protein